MYVYILNDSCAKGGCSTLQSWQTEDRNLCTLWGNPTVSGGWVGEKCHRGMLLEHVCSASGSVIMLSLIINHFCIKNIQRQNKLI